MFKQISFITLLSLILLSNAELFAGSKAESFYKKALKYKKEFFYDKALEELTKAIEADSNFADAYEVMGDILWHNGGFEKYAIAEEKYTLSINQNPDNAELFLNRADMRMHNGKQESYADIDAAIILLNKQIAKNPRAADLYFQRGSANCLYIAYMGEMKRAGEANLPGTTFDENIAEAAKTDLLKAVELNPKFTEAYYKLCFFYGGNIRRDQDSIIWACNKIIEIDPQELDAFMRRGGAYRNKKANDKAIADFTVVIDTNPNYSRAYSQRAEAFRAAGDVNSAIADYGKMIELDPSNRYYYFSRASFFRDQKRYDEALNDINTAITYNSNSSRAYSERALCYKDMKEYDKAIADYGIAAENFKKPGSEFAPETPDPYRGRAAIHTLKGDYGAAIKDYTLSIELYGWSGNGLAWNYRQRGWSYSQKKDYENAIADYSKWIELKPQEADAYNTRGDAYMNFGNYQSALADLKKGLEIDPANYWCLLTSGEVYTRLKDFYKAEDVLSQAIKIKAKHPAGWYYRGLNYKAKGDRYNARKDFKMAEDLGGYKDSKAELEALGN